MRPWVRGTTIGILFVALTGCEIVPAPRSAAEPGPAQPTAPAEAPPETSPPPAGPAPTTATPSVTGPLPLPALPPAPVAERPTGPAVQVAATVPAMPSLPVDARRAQIDGRLTALRAWLANTGRRALLLELPENFAWATFGGENQPVAGAPAVALAVLPNRALLVGPSDIIELVRGPLAGLELRGLEYRWDLGRDPAAMVDAVRGVAGPGAIAADTHRPGTEFVADEIAVQRLALVSIERQRLSWLAATAGEAVAEVLGNARAEMRQTDVAAELWDKLTAAGVGVADLRVASLDKLTTRGLGEPSAAAVGGGIAVHVTVERWGLQAVIGRSVSPGADETAVDAMVTARRIYAGLLAAVGPGKVLRNVHQAATKAAMAAGAGEPFAVQPPGGVGAYRPFTRLFSATAIEPLTAQQAVQLTVLVPGAYVADTALLGTDSVQLLTVTPGWPSPAELVNGRPVPLPTLRGGELAMVAAEQARSVTEQRAAALDFLSDLVGDAARQAIAATPAPAPVKVEAEAPAEPSSTEAEDEERPRTPAGATAPAEE